MFTETVLKLMNNIGVVMVDCIFSRVQLLYPSSSRMKSSAYYLTRIKN